VRDVEAQSMCSLSHAAATAAVSLFTALHSGWSCKNFGRVSRLT
jgi:hypothetical protein